MQIVHHLILHWAALITLGAMVTDARGSIGGTVFSKNKGGAYTRARTAPINRRTTAQSIVRNNFASNSKTWSGSLTAAERAAWNAFAASNPLVNRLGASIKVSGFNMFQKLNQVLSQIGSSNITDPPPDLSVPAIGTGLGTGAAVAGASLEVDTTAQVAASGGQFYVFATPPLAPGKTPQTSDYRFLRVADPSAAAVTLSLYADYIALFGPFISGNVIGVGLSTVNDESGAVTPSVITQIAAT